MITKFKLFESNPNWEGTPIQYINKYIRKERELTDDEINDLLKLYKSRTQAQLNNDLSNLLKNRKILPNSINTIMVEMIDQGINMDTIVSCLYWVFIYSCDFLNPMLDFVKKLLVLIDSETVFAILYNTISKFYNSKHDYCTKMDDPVKFWSKVFKYFDTSISINMMIYSKLHKYVDDNAFPKERKKWIKRKKWINDLKSIANKLNISKKEYDLYLDDGDACVTFNHEELCWYDDEPIYDFLYRLSKDINIKKFNI